MEKNFNRDDYQIIILIQIGESLVEKIFDDHQVTIQTGEPLIEELLDTDLEETEDPFELKIGLTFTNWPEFKIWLDNFAKKKGFNYKVRNSWTDGGIMRNIIYECSRSGIHDPQVTSDPAK